MPVEAIHLSAFVDSLHASRAPAELRSGELLGLGRLGCLVIDLPYFENFPLGVLRYLLHRPTAQSLWGEQLHKGNPVRAAESMLEAARQERSPRLSALALGFVSHLAVDRSMHPLVNRLARERARELGGDVAHHHTEIEKYHSVLFHEERNGFDFMGEPALRAHIEVDADAVHRDPDVFATLDAAFAATTGRAPGREAFTRWSRGYRQYVWLVSSPAGKRLAPAPMKKRARSSLYSGAWGSFAEAYGAAVSRSRDAIDAALGWLAAPAQDEPCARELFNQTLPAGPIDLD